MYHKRQNVADWKFSEKPLFRGFFSIHISLYSSFFPYDFPQQKLCVSLMQLHLEKHTKDVIIIYNCEKIKIVWIFFFKGEFFPHHRLMGKQWHEQGWNVLTSRLTDSMTSMKTSFFLYLMPSERHDTALVTVAGGRGAPTSNLWPSWVMYLKKKEKKAG